MTTIKFRRDYSANWASINPIPAQGEPCYEIDTDKLKIGNGADNYTDLPYVTDGGTATIPVASSTTLGGIKVGDNLSVTEDGTLSTGSEAKTVLTPNGRLKLDNAGLHNKDNSRAIISRDQDRQEVTVGNIYEKTVINGSSIKLNSTTITDRDGNTFLTGNTINGVKLSRDTSDNAIVANASYEDCRLSLTINGGELYDSDNRKVFGSVFSAGRTRTDWKFASQSDTLRIANDSNSNDQGITIKTPTGGVSPTIGYTYYGTDADLYGKEQTFLRTEDVDNSTIKIVNGKLTASGGSTPTNMVTTDTEQTISGKKTFTGSVILSGEVTDGSSNKIVTKISNIDDAYNSSLYKTSGLTFTRSGSGYSVRNTGYGKTMAFNGITSTGYKFATLPDATGGSFPTEDANWASLNIITDNTGFYNPFNSRFVLDGSGILTFPVYVTFTDLQTIKGLATNMSQSMMDGGMNLELYYTDDFITTSSQWTKIDDLQSNTLRKKYYKIQYTYPISGTGTTYVDLPKIGMLVINSQAVNKNGIGLLLEKGTPLSISTKGGLQLDLDTKYLKFDETNKKLTVDTAAVAHLAMPSSTSVNLTLGASGTTYTAPNDGYFVANVTSAYTGMFKIDGRCAQASNPVNMQFACSCAAYNDESLKIWYTFSSGDASAIGLRFSYCNGTVPANMEPDF